MSICLCENKVYISKGLKQSDKVELSYSDILDVVVKNNNITIITRNNKIGLLQIKQSGKVVDLLKNKINENK